MGQQGIVAGLFLLNLSICFAGSLLGLFSNSTGNFVTKFDFATGQFIQSDIVDLPQSNPQQPPLLPSSAYDYTSNIFAVASGSCVYEIDSDDVVHSHSFPGPVTYVLYDPNKDRIVALVEVDGDLFVIDVGEKKAEAFMPAPSIQGNVYWGFSFDQKSSVLYSIYSPPTSSRQYFIGKMDMSVFPPQSTTTNVTHCLFSGTVHSFAYDSNRNTFVLLFVQEDTQQVHYLELDEATACTEANINLPTAAVNAATYDYEHSVFYFVLANNFGGANLFYAVNTTNHQVLTTSKISPSDSVWALAYDVSDSNI